MVTAIVITSEKEVSEREIDGLDAMQAIVGGLIEPVTLSDGSTMFVNEEFVYMPDLRFNSIASDVAGLGGRSDLMLRGIAGNVFIVGPVDDDGNDTDVTDKARRWVRRVAREA